MTQDLEAGERVGDVSISFAFETALDTICSVTKETKDTIRQIWVGILLLIIGLIVTALIKGEELKGLGKPRTWGRVLCSNIPLWIFLIVLIIAVAGAVRWLKSRQKRVIYVEWKNDICLWCLADGGNEPWMQVSLHGFFTNADLEVALIITSIYLENTRPAMTLYEPLNLPPHEVTSQDVSVMVKPLLLEEGKTFRGNVVFVDQYQRRHKASIELKGYKPHPQAVRDVAKSTT